ncbi:hypothetical protein ABC304_16765 [Microbacterium sp. 1P10UB]|uniref:hypothetical protein n=1 Tax=unclassified Microbacterium TaxID=2609290 RepID=UPI0039A08527
MSAYPAWTPATRPGIIPLHPLGFGTILGRSFSVLRHNPKVLLGFALPVQVVSYLVVLLGVVGVGFLTFSRLETLRWGTDEFEAVTAGSIALTAVTGIVLGLAAGAMSVLVQGVVVSEVAAAVLAEKLPLRALWRRVRPVAWRLVGFTALVSVAVFLLLGILAGLLFLIAQASLPVAVGLIVLSAIGLIPLSLWLSTKLSLVASAIILEDARIGQAIGRSWLLIRGRFWPALGIIVIISMVFGAIGQVISIPFSFLSSGLGTIIAPTGEPDATSIIAVLATSVLVQVLTLAIQAVAVVVQSTAVALIYIDCRMRREGLDADLLSYVDQRDAGATGLPDPYRAHIGREIPRPPAYGGYGVQPASYAPPAGYAAAPAPYGYAAPAPGSPQNSGYPQGGSYPQSGSYPQGGSHPQGGVSPQDGPYPPPQPAPPASAAAPDEQPSATRWAAPGSSEDRDAR